MPKATKRPRRASLRGWSKYLPFLCMVFGLFFVFTWLHAQRWHNDRRATVLAQEIRALKAKNGALLSKRHVLNRMERLTEAAQSYALVEPKPGQIIVIEVTPLAEAQAAPRARAVNAATPSPTRSAAFRLAPPEGTPERRPSLFAELAHRAYGIISPENEQPL